MALHFDITADNSNFISQVNEVKANLNSTQDVLKRVHADTESFQTKIAALNNAIKENDIAFTNHAKDIKQWSEALKNAFESGDTAAMDRLNDAILNAASEMQNLTKQTEEYKSALLTVESIAGMEASTMPEVNAPKLYINEADYELANNLREAISQLKEEMAGFTGPDEELLSMQEKLAGLEENLNGIESKAADAAASLGANLGTRAAEASSALYELNDAVTRQNEVVESLKNTVNAAANELQSLKDNNASLGEIEYAKNNFDALSVSLTNAENQLRNLQAAQQDASAQWSQVNAEVQQHDSIMVKMLGGYENYTQIISQLPAPLQSVIGGISGMTGAAKAFIATPLGAVIAAIVLALQTLNLWFNSSREGQLAFAEVSGYVNGILGQLKEVVYAVGKAIYKAFSDPEKAVKHLWQTIKDNIVNRVEAVGGIFKSLGGVISKALEFKWDEAGEEFKRLASNAATAATGIKDVGDKISNATKNLGKWGKTVQDNAKATARLSVEEKQIQIDEADMRLKNSEREKRMSDLRGSMYSRDNNKSGKAIAEYEKLSEEIMKDELAIQQRKLNHRRELNSLTSSTIEDEIAEKELERGLNQIEAAHKSRMAMLQRRKNRLETPEKGSTAAQLASKTLAEEQQLTDLLKRQAEERLRQQQSYEYELWQNRIDLMEEGEAKVLAQMRLDNAKELTALKERQEQEIQAEIAAQKAVFDAREDVIASKQKGYGKKVFNSDIDDKDNKDIDRTKIAEINQRYEQLYADLAAKQAKTEQDRLDAAKESMNAYLQEFGNYQQKRLAIQEEYDTRIAEAQNEGQRMTLYAQRDKALADLDYSEWMESGDIALAFGDIAKLSDSTIEQLIADMERYREKVIATFDPEKIREYEEALTRLRDVQSENSFGVFASVIPDYFKQRQSVASQRDSAGANLNALANQRTALLNRKSALEGAQAKGGNMTMQLEEVNAELNANDEATRKAQNAFKQLQEQWDQMNSPEDKFYGICDAVNQAAGMVGDLANQAAAMADAMGADGLGAALGTLGEAMGSVQNVASGFAQGGLIDGIAAAAGEAMKWVGKLFTAGDNKRQKNIERLQEQIDALNKSYEKLNSEIEDAFSTDASDLIDQQNTLLQQQKVLIKQQMAEEEAKKKTDDEKIKEYKERLEEIDETLADNKKKAKEAIVGEDIKSAISEFSDAYASAWENGTDAASKSMSAVKNILKSALTELLNKNLQPKVQEFYDLVAKYAEGGFTEAELNALDVIKRQIDAASQSMEEQFKTIENRYKDLDELKEELTDISFDSVRDNFKSQLLDMEADASDFTASFTDMLRSAVVEGLMDNKYDVMLKEWYDEFAEAMDNQTLTDEERDSLRQKYESIINQGIADRNAINEIIGGGAYSQEASKGGWESMGQDQAEELNGRFTALTELQVISNDLQQTQNTLSAQILATLQGMSLISGTANGNDPTLLAIKDMMFLQTGYLEDIARYTRILNSVDERLATLNNSIDRKL